MGQKVFEEYLNTSIRIINKTAFKQDTCNVNIIFVTVFKDQWRRTYNLRGVTAHLFFRWVGL